MGRHNNGCSGQWPRLTTNNAQSIAVSENGSLTRQRIKSPEYHHMICIGKTKCSSEKGLLISEPTRITPTSSTLIDLCITSSPEKISKAGVVHLGISGISDHSLVFMTLKISYKRTGSHRTIETRAFKKFNHHHFLDDVAQQPWNNILSKTNPEAMWDVWKKIIYGSSW